MNLQLAEVGDGARSAGTELQIVDPAPQTWCSQATSASKRAHHTDAHWQRSQVLSQGRRTYGKSLDRLRCSRSQVLSRPCGIIRSYPLEPLGHPIRRAFPGTRNRSANGKAFSGTAALCGCWRSARAQLASVRRFVQSMDQLSKSIAPIDATTAPLALRSCEREDAALDRCRRACRNGLRRPAPVSAPRIASRRSIRRPAVCSPRDPFEDSARRHRFILQLPQHAVDPCHSATLRPECKSGYAFSTRRRIRSTKSGQPCDSASR